MPGAVRAQVRATVRRLYRRLGDALARPLSPAELGEPAIVFAPHPDDETLGCGGTILRKRALGAEVDLVFLTDGSRSHPRRMAPAALRSIRHQEAERAAALLGVDAGRVHQLGFADGELAAAADAAAAAVAEVLRRRPAGQVFLPYRHEAPDDHRAAWEVVRAALGRVGRRPACLEYPVWCWSHWPWTPGPPRRLGLRAVARSAVASRLGLRLLLACRARVAVEGVLDRKRAALAAYASQTTRFDGDPAWTTLGDVASGEWLDCFFQPWEVFHRGR